MVTSTSALLRCSFADILQTKLGMRGCALCSTRPAASRVAPFDGVELLQSPGRSAACLRSTGYQKTAFELLNSLMSTTGPLAAGIGQEQQVNA
jgi:hypothetical protein